MHPPLDHGLSFEHFLVKIRSDLHTFSDKRIDKTRLPPEHILWQKGLKTRIPRSASHFDGFKKQNKRRSSVRHLHKADRWISVRKKLHQFFPFFCQWFEHITNFMKSTFYLFRFLRNPLSKSRSWILFLFVFGFLMFCYFLLYWFRLFFKLFWRLFFLYTFFRRRRLQRFSTLRVLLFCPGNEVGPPVRADPPETASMRFETSILTLRLGTTPLLLQGNTARKTSVRRTGFPIHLPPGHLPDIWPVQTERYLPTGSVFPILPVISSLWFLKSTEVYVSYDSTHCLPQIVSDYLRWTLLVWHHLFFGTHPARFLLSAPVPLRIHPRDRLRTAQRPQKYAASATIQRKIPVDFVSLG